MEELTDLKQAIETLNNSALQHKQNGNFQQSIIEYQKAIDLTVQALGEDDVNVPTFMNNIASVHLAQGNYAAAEDLNKKALSLRIRKLGENSTVVAGDYTDFAHTLLLKGEHARAELLFEKARSIFRGLPAENEVPLLNWYYTIASVLYENRCYRLLETYLNHAVEISEGLQEGQALADIFRNLLHTLRSEVSSP